MKRRFKTKPNLLALLTFIVFLFSIFKAWGVFSMSNLLLIEDVSVLSKSDTLDEGTIAVEGNRVSASGLKFHKVGDYITYSIKIKNDKDENYILKSISASNTNEYISYAYDDYKDIKLNSGESFDFIFTETYSTEVDDIQKREQNFSVDFYLTLQPEKKDDNTDDTETKDDTFAEKIRFRRNPATGDKIEIYIALAIISLVLSIFIFRKTNIKKIKKSSLGLLALFTAIYIAFIPQMAKTLEGQAFKVKLENRIELKDKLLVTYDVDETKYTKIIPYNTKLSIEDPSKGGYTFKGWRTDDGALFDLDALIKDDINLTAVFEADVYNISYNLNGGQAENPDRYTIEDEVHINDPLKEGYTFEGWTGTDLTELTKNLVIPQGSTNDRAYEAHWSANEYTVLFDANTGAGSMNSATFTYDVASYLPSNTFTKADNKFRCWNTQADGSGTSYSDESYIKNLASEGEVTLYAQWTSRSNWTMFIDGKSLNAKMKQLAGNSGANFDTMDYNIYSIERSTSDPPTSAVNVAVSGAEYTPIYMWYDENTHTIYYCSESKYIYLNKYSQNVFGYFNSLVSIDFNGFLTDSVLNMSGMFTHSKSLVDIDLSTFNTAKVTDMSSMFNQCNGATRVDVSHFDTRNVKNMNRMFTGCTSITELDLSRFNTSKVENMEKMFDYLPLVESIDISGFDTSKVTNMWGMFRDCPKLRTLDVSNFDTSNVTNMTEMFGCSYTSPGPQRVDHSGITSITIGPKFTTEKVTSMLRMFNKCTELESFNYSNRNQGVFIGFNTKNVTNMEGMFSYCAKLTVLDLSAFDTGKVTNMTKMFSNMTSLTTIYVSDKFTVGSGTTGNSVFLNDTLLVGGNGTTYDPNNVGKSYARIDGGELLPGYFTRKV